MDARHLFLIVSLFFLECATAAPPNCAPGVQCPPGGMWGEWTTFGNTKCSMDCGGCGLLFQTRTCMSSQISGCPCTGDASRYIPCNMQTCKYPAQRSCCPPYLSMVVNGVSTCGPLPKTMRDPGASCCPVGGMWSDFAGYERIGNRWIRRRTCLSAAIGCDCTGSATQESTNCPCLQPTSAAASLCTGFENREPYEMPTMDINHEACTATIQMTGHNNLPQKYCNRPDPKVYNYIKPTRYIALLIMNEVDGGCAFDDVFDCQHGQTTDAHMNATFTCDTTSLRWIYDYTGKQITSYVQGVYTHQT